jgi:hypothetical protein
MSGTLPRLRGKAQMLAKAYYIMLDLSEESVSFKFEIM